jgi:ankyrin repeat protein
MNMKLFFTSALAVLIVFSAHAKGSDSNSVYFAAAEQGDVATLQQFFATNLNAASLVNDLLRTAVLGGQKDTTELLIQRGADVNHKGSFDLTPLAHLAMYGSSDDAKCTPSNPKKASWLACCSNTARMLFLVTMAFAPA